jgi:hypothetical protein
LGRTDDKLDPGPSTYREMRDVRRFRLRHRADDSPGVRLRLHQPSTRDQLATTIPLA